MKRRHSPEIGDFPSTIQQAKDANDPEDDETNAKQGSPMISSRAVQDHLAGSARIDVTKYPKH